MVNYPATPDPGPAVAAAIELLVRQGYDATSVDDLADAAGISRSTFFRKFGSKEDIVFADHDRILAQVQDFLAGTTADPLHAVVDAALLVFGHHMGNRKTSVARYELLHQVPALRDRELVMTHRYQRAFRNHLLSALPEGEGTEVTAVAFAASIVAVHNSVLRRWLRSVAAGERVEGVEHGGREAQEAEAHELAAQLSRELGALADTFARVLAGPAGSEVAGGPSAESSRPAVVVAVLDRAAGTEEIIQAVRNALA
ncbi:TetR/AcrR family transcriptional regulator [Arthrobacter sp. FW306-2-2C-D06B]|uniref:TetR/AcrR family transcriptional regulator n=1 Tax=Arthrobacter sp. FW306-2-2C-D06B TaxID=2879618 RepID=UPI001F22535D|nr:TetR/AcrR family transcriptional regulator [Arthrobacter sp. FW306-2-2C-D06B]UKA58573.1 TetR/AcrR family transcriptional regulator; helix-turn-helix transcriptional regulator [Arthrobacter sp. FW306-2-2C-D06B]